MMKKIIGIMLILVLLYSLVSLGRYYYIKSEYTEPYKMVGEFIKEAENDSSSSMHLISEQEWNSISEDSIFANTRKPLEWQEFKSFVYNCKKPKYSLVLDEGNATYDVMKMYYQENYRSINVMCFEYNTENGQHIGLEDIKLKVEYIKDSWKVVGRSY